MSELTTKIETAVKLLRFWCRESQWKTYFLPGMVPDLTPQLCFSGGKDSVLIRFLCDKAGIKYRAVYSVTTIDPPPLVRFIKQKYPDVEFSHSGTNFFHELVKKGFPTRQRRWCCELFKENTGDSLIKIIGVRAAESARRAKQWRSMTQSWKRQQVFLCPALNFSDAEVWQVIKAEGLPYCELYDCGFRRLGCIACPMAGAECRKRELSMFPGFERLYRRAFFRLWEKRAGTVSTLTKKEWFGSRKFRNSDELFEWWLLDISSPADLERTGFGVEDLEGDGELLNFADSCDMGMF